MLDSTASSRSASGLSRRSKRTVGATLAEVMMAVALLGIGAGTALSSLGSANRTAEVNRSRSAALALCQERIDEIVASNFSPPSKLPSFFGKTWPVPTAETTTATETVQVHTDPNGNGTVTGTRTTLVSLADAATKLVRVTVRVSFNYRGRNYVCQSSTLRSTD